MINRIYAAADRIILVNNRLISSITLNACLLRQAFFVLGLARLASENFF